MQHTDSVRACNTLTNVNVCNTLTLLDVATYWHFDSLKNTDTFITCNMWQCLSLQHWHWEILQHIVTFTVCNYRESSKTIVGANWGVTVRNLPRSWICTSPQSNYSRKNNIMQTTDYVYIYVCVCLCVDVHVCAFTLCMCLYVYVCTSLPECILNIALP